MQIFWTRTPGNARHKPAPGAGEQGGREGCPARRVPAYSRVVMARISGSVASMRPAARLVK
ncbi:MAG: hypothetical protein ACRDHW_19390, partial [Ktedonobacteraceae bacterium]